MEHKGVMWIFKMASEKVIGRKKSLGDSMVGFNVLKMVKVMELFGMGVLLDRKACTLTGDVQFGG